MKLIDIIVLSIAVIMGVIGISVAIYNIYLTDKILAGYLIFAVCVVLFTLTNIIRGIKK